MELRCQLRFIEVNTDLTIDNRINRSSLYKKNYIVTCLLRNLKHVRPLKVQMD